MKNHFCLLALPLHAVYLSIEINIDSFGLLDSGNRRDREVSLTSIRFITRKHSYSVFSIEFVCTGA